MTTLLRALYAFMCWSTELELALAREYSSMAYVNHLTERLKYWELEAMKLEWRMEWIPT